MNVFRQLTRKLQISFVLGVFAFLFGIAGVFAASLPTRAASCDKVNIVYCGLTGSDLGGYISSVKQLYAANSDNGHSDIRQMLEWGGFTSDVVNAMDTNNSRIGTLHRDGAYIEVGGVTVATNVQISARFTSGAGFTQVKSGVWSRSATNMVNATDQVIVTFDADGRVRGALVIRCGNTLQYTPVLPVYSCDLLAITPATQVVGANVHGDFAYTAKNGASLNSTSIDWGDGTTNSGYDHTYTTAGTYTITGTLHMSYWGTGVNVTSAACAKQIVITPTMCTIPGKEQYPADSPECRADVPGVSITKTVIDDSQKSATVKVGEQYSYTLVVKNTGNVNLVQPVVTDAPHAGVTLVSTDLGTISNNVLTATIPTTLTPGQTYVIHLKAVVPAYVQGTIENDACVNAKEVNTPSNAANNDSCDKADVTVVKEAHPAVTITKTVNGKKTDEVVLGDTYSYEVTVKNTGDVVLTNAAVNDRPEAGVVLLSQVDGLGNISNNQWTYVIPSLAVGESKTFKFTAKVTEYHSAAIVNTACVNAVEVNPTTPDKKDACDTATVTVRVKNPAISITKTINGAKNANLAVGTAFTYEITVKNTGEVALSNVVVTDQAPAGVTFTGADRGVIDGNGAWTYTIPSLAVGESTQFVINAKVNAYKASTIVNVACVNAPAINVSEPNKADACDSADLTTPTVPEVIPDTNTPTVLPNTGAAGVVSLAIGVALLSSVFYSIFQTRKLAREDA